VDGPSVDWRFSTADELPWMTKGREGFCALAAKGYCWIVLETGF